MVSKAKTKKVMKTFTPKRAVIAKIGSEPLELPNLSGMKKYSDERGGLFPVKLNEIENPDASKTFNLGNNKFLSFTSVDRTPIADEGIFNFECQGNFTGDLVHIHQHTGNAGAGTVLLRLEGEDTDIIPLVVETGGTISATFDKNVGIGTTSPGAPLHIKSDETGGEMFRLDRTDNASINELFTVGVSHNAGTSYAYFGERVGANVFPGFTVQEGTRYVGIGSTGIALTTLHVFGDATITGTVNDGLELATSAAPTTDAMIANKKYVDDNAGGNPAGTILMYGAAAAPTGYLLCNGAAVSRTTYSVLFGIIGTTYGVGDGSTTFNVPGFASKFPRGVTAGATGGADTHTLSVAEMPAHKHAHNFGAAVGGVAGHPQSNNIIGNSTVFEQNAGGGGSHNNIPAYLGVNFIIKT